MQREARQVWICLLVGLLLVPLVASRHHVNPPLRHYRTRPEPTAKPRHITGQKHYWGNNMASQGPLGAPSTVTNDATVGSTDWIAGGGASSLVDGLSAEDTKNASPAILPPSTVLHYLKCTGFGFSVPGGATINGILVEIRRADSGATANCLDNSIKLVKGGTIGGNDYATGTTWPLSGALAYASYGGASDLWGLTWTDTDINASNFGVAISAQKSGTAGSGVTQVDYVRITVYYTTGGGGGSTSGFFF